MPVQFVFCKGVNVDPWVGCDIDIEMYGIFKIADRFRVDGPGRS